ncbi:hypothetical protein GCM10027594_32570 [Hymenobacter agri]
MDMHHIRRGAGKPLLLVHGIGGSWRSWNTILDTLAAEREVIAVDLPGHGDTPPLPGENSIGTFADALTDFLTRHNLLGIDAVGSSMGARLVLEMARRGGSLGAVVSLDPGGFWEGWEIPVFYEAGEGAATHYTRPDEFGGGAHGAAAAVFGPPLGRGCPTGPRRDVYLRPHARVR